MKEIQETSTTTREVGREQRVATFKVTQILWLLLSLLEAAIGLRVVFKLVGVNEANQFAGLLYLVTDLFLAPFRSLVGAPSAGGMVLEISSIIAMIVYLIITWALVKIVSVLFYRPRGPVSVRQTTVAEQIPQPEGQDTSTSQTTVTKRTNTRLP